MRLKLVLERRRHHSSTLVHAMCRFIHALPEHLSSPRALRSVLYRPPDSSEEPAAARSVPDLSEPTSFRVDSRPTGDAIRASVAGICGFLRWPELNRSDLQELSRVRRRDAHALLRSGQYPGAYYLTGYAVECALEACVARTVRRHDFPDRNLASRTFTHDLDKLLKLAGLEAALQADTAFNPQLNLNWAVVKDWTAEARYDHSTSKARATDLCSACTARKNGILAWVRKRW